MQNINKKVASATRWSLVTEFAAKLIAPIVNIILARILVPEAFGAVATITMIISFAEIFTDAGFQKYIVQHNFSDDEDFDKSVNVAFWSNFTFSAILVAVICIFKNPIAVLVGSPELATGISVASLSIIFAAFSSIQMAVYRRKLDFKTLFYVRIVTSLIPLIVTVPLAFFFRNYWALLVGTLCMHFVQAMILTLRSEWKPRFYYSFKKFSEMFAFTSWTLLETISIWLTTNIGTFIVGRSLDDYYLGLYKTSMTTVNSYMSIITMGITPVLFSALSRHQNNEKMFRQTYFQFQKLMSVLLMPMGIGIFVYRELVVTILLGEKWMESSNFVGLWGMMSALTVVFNNLSSEVFRSKGRPDISLWSQVIHLGFLIPSLLWSINYGFEALYVTRSLIRIEIVVGAMILSSIFFKIKIRDSVKNVLPQTISAIAMGGVALFIKDIFSGMVWQIVSVGICVIVYFAILLSFRDMRKTIFELDFVKKVLNKIRRENDKSF